MKCRYVIVCYYLTIMALKSWGSNRKGAFVDTNNEIVYIVP